MGDSALGVSQRSDQTLKPVPSSQTAINALVINPSTTAPHQTTLLSLELEDFNSSVAYIPQTLPALPQSGKYTVVVSFVRTTIPAVTLV